jgi:hypothetical protein
MPLSSSWPPWERPCRYRGRVNLDEQGPPSTRSAMLYWRAGWSTTRVRWRRRWPLQFAKHLFRRAGQAGLWGGGGCRCHGALQTTTFLRSRNKTSPRYKRHFPGIAPNLQVQENHSEPAGVSTRSEPLQPRQVGDYIIRQRDRLAEFDQRLDDSDKAAFALHFKCHILDRVWIITNESIWPPGLRTRASRRRHRSAGPQYR